MSMINSLNFESDTHTFTLPYGVCSTAAATAAKTVTVDNFSLEAGAAVVVKFTYANSVASPTLNVNGTGAKPIYRYGTTVASTGTTTSGWIAGAVQMFVFDGTGWVRDYWNNTTYSNASLGQGYGTCDTAAATVAKVVTLSSYSLITGGIVAVKFTYAVPAGATMNINSKGAKAIYYRGAAITAGIIAAGDVAVFVYNGTYYHLLTVDRSGNMPTSLKNPQKMTINGVTYDGSSAVDFTAQINTLITEATSEKAETIQVLSDNLFDQSIATTGKFFYHGYSNISILDESRGFIAYVPLRGAGTYRTVVWYANSGATLAAKAAILTSDNTFLQYATGTLTTIDSTFAYLEFTVTSDMISNGAAVYAFTGWSGSTVTHSLSSVMIVKDRDYPSTYIPYGYIEKEVGGTPQSNILSGKTAVFVGDSICAGTTTLSSDTEYGWGWGGIIGEANKMNWKNYGRNGGTIAPISSVAEERWIPYQVDLATAELPDADYVIFEGGCNDADLLGSSGLGTLSTSGYAPTTSATNFTAAFEALVLQILNAYPNAKVGYIVAPKMGVSNDYGSTNNNYRVFFDRAVEICKKWGIPVLDLWNNNPMNPKLAVYYDSSLTADAANTSGKGYTDGQHLTLTGYKRISPQIEAFMRSL